MSLHDSENYDESLDCKIVERVENRSVEDDDSVTTSNRNLLAFFIAGLINNSSYVIMIAGAKDIDPSMVGLVYICLVVPSFMVKLSGPYWFHLLGYRSRILLATICMVSSFVTVAFGSMNSSLAALQFAGIVLGSFQSALGECTFLAFAAFFNSRKALTAWSSGTGVAGIFGYAWVVFFTVGLRTSFAFALLIALILPITYWLNYVVIFKLPIIKREQQNDEPLNNTSSHPLLTSTLSYPISSIDAPSGKAYSSSKDGFEINDSRYRASVADTSNGTFNVLNQQLQEKSLDSINNGGDIDYDNGSNSLSRAPKYSASKDEDKEKVDLSKAAAVMSTKERFNVTLSLWPYMIPLFVVYFAEYAMQSGVWAAIGFPVTSENARNSFYLYSNWCYQFGVFLSRSSGTIWKANMKALWIMPGIQLCILIMFIFDAYYMWWYSWSLLVACFVVGKFTTLYNTSLLHFR